MSYRKLLWNHKPITDFWRVGKGYSKRLEKHNIYTMGDIMSYFCINVLFIILNSYRFKEVII